MTAATYTTNLGNIYRDESTANWTAIGTGGAGLTADTDYFIQGTLCLTKSAFASSTKGMIYADPGGDFGGTGTDGAYIAWMTHTAPNSLDTLAGGGMRFIIGSANGDYEHYYVGGSDTMTFQGWLLVAVNEATAGDTTTGSPSATVESHFGGLWDLPSGGPTKGAPNAIDGIRGGRCDAVIEFGTGADPEATFDGCVTTLDSVTNRYGLLTQRVPGGTFENSGLIQFGTSTNAVEFLDSNKSIVIRDHPHVTANFNTWEVNNASSIINMTNITVKALGTQSPGRWVTNNDPTINLTTCIFDSMGAFAFDANSTLDACTFLSCDTITANEADLTGCSVLTSSAATDGSAVQWDEAISTAHGIPELDNMTFSMGANNHHAITFGTGVASGADIILTGIEFTGFDADGTGDSDNSILEFLATTGTITVNLIGCTVDGSAASSSNFTVDERAGCTVNVTFDPKTTKITTEDQSGTMLENVRVLLETDDHGGGSGLDYRTTIISITESGGTATCTASINHGLVTGDYVVVRNANPVGHTGQHQVTVTGATTFTYSTNGSGSATGTAVDFIINAHDETNFDNSPTTEGTFTGGSGYSVSDLIYLSTGVRITVDAVSTGTVTQFTVSNLSQHTTSVANTTETQHTTSGTGVGFTLTPDTGNLSGGFTMDFSYAAISGLTDSVGEIESLKTWPVSQGLIGSARKSTSSPFFKTSQISVADASGGTDLLVLMISDE